MNSLTIQYIIIVLVFIFAGYFLYKIIRKNLHKYKLPRIKWIVSTSNDDPVNLVALIESLNAGNNEQKVEQIAEKS